MCLLGYVWEEYERQVWGLVVERHRLNAMRFSRRRISTSYGNYTLSFTFLTLCFLFISAKCNNNILELKHLSNAGKTLLRFQDFSGIISCSVLLCL